MLMLSWAFVGWSGCPVVLADQLSDSPLTVDSGGHVDHFAGVVYRRVERTALMGAMLVEMVFILGQNGTQVPFTADDQVVEAFAPPGSVGAVR
ncbi:hypothetical protein [Nonomuraea sp. CA-141351]|uniref:hypothetical protein n=1 Tax=Nonomuraea sp. CA-141351 TaxID=3239996 RepID=UPI003D902642